jgi:hypothetical protein
LTGSVVVAEIDAEAEKVVVVEEIGDAAVGIVVVANEKAVVARKEKQKKSHPKCQGPLRSQVREHQPPRLVRTSELPCSLDQEPMMDQVVADEAQIVASVVDCGDVVVVLVVVVARLGPRWAVAASVAALALEGHQIRVLLLERAALCPPNRCAMADE